MDFTKPLEFGDVTFIVEGRKIYAMKGILGSVSEVFKHMFTSDFKEKNMDEIPLPDTKFDDFLQLIEILHPPNLKRVDDSNVHCLLPLAHFYNIKHVLLCCEETLSQAPSILNLILAQKFQLTQLRKKCVQYLKDTRLTELQSEDGFEELDPKTLVTVLTYKFESLQGEVSHITKWQDIEGPAEKCKGCKWNNARTFACSDCKAYRFDMIGEVMKKY